MTGITDPAQEFFKDGLWAWVTDQWKKLVADASQFLQINIAAQDIDVEVTQTAAADLTPGIMGWDGSAWRKLPLLWGYSDRLFEDIGGTQSNAGTYTGVSTAVPAGEIHVIQLATILDESAAPTSLRIDVRAGAVPYRIARVLTPAQSTPLVWQGEICLKESDSMRVRAYGCGDGDEIQAAIWGYKMKVAQ